MEIIYFHPQALGSLGQPGLDQKALDHQHSPAWVRPHSLRSAFQFGDLETSQSQEFPTGQALPCIYTPTIPITRERSGLVHQCQNQPNTCHDY
jgi:hypothetical protein